MASQEPTAFPKTLRAVKKADRSLWEISDALLEEIGPPRVHGKKDGSLVLFDVCAEWLREHGFRYRADTLRRMRHIAFMWPPEKRRPDLSYNMHKEMKSPELLAEYERKTEGSLTPSAVRRFKRAQDEIATPEKTPRTKLIDCMNTAIDAAYIARSIIEQEQPSDSETDDLLTRVQEEWQLVAQMSENVARIS